MPALVNFNVGSFFTTIGAEGTTVCPFDTKKSRNFLLISALVIINGTIFGCYLARTNYICAHGFRIKSRAKVHQIRLFYRSTLLKGQRISRGLTRDRMLPDEEDQVLL